jgi:fatty-acyl-CoA synthase
MEEIRMLGQMQDWPLRLHQIIDHAARHHAGREVVSRSTEGPTHRTTYPEIRARALCLAQRLTREGIRPGDRIATMAWNTWRHLESWFGIAGAGAVCHTVNPRLFPDQIVWILNHAGSRVMLADLGFVPLLEKLAPQLPAIERYVLLTDAAHMPASAALRGVVAYEDWIAEMDGDFAWAAVDENEAYGLCYTSGTTGDPKGVLYSHRSTVLHTMMALHAEVLGFTARDRIGMVSPMFHANAWVMPHAAAMAGAALVLPGQRLDPVSLHTLFEEERVTVSAAVPTVWTTLLQHLEATGGRLSTVKRILSGGSAVPRALVRAYRDQLGIPIQHMWGMTEMSPIGTCAAVKPEVADRDAEGMLDLGEKQGCAPFTVDFKITDDEGRSLPWDGRTLGRLKVMGPGVAKTYFRMEQAGLLDDEGFFDTGDVATIDPHGYVEIKDRSKDLLKSGGEWISSIALENLASSHPGVAEAAAVAVPHPKWGERPLLVVVPKQGATPTRDALLEFLEGKVARWWLPDDVVFVEEIPHTAVGKVEKKALRAMFRDQVLPECR